MYDIVFLSHSEAKADEHWASLLLRFPRAVRVHGVDGIVAAHQRAAEIVNTRWFWVVDADNLVKPTFDFSFKWPTGFQTANSVAVWRAENNVNGLIYGYGGIKLLPKRAVLNVDPTVVDFTTSIGDNFRIMHDVASTTVIDSTPFEAWKSAFRECAKLASNIIDRSKSGENLYRVEAWGSTGESPYMDEVFRGAREGRAYGEAHVGDRPALVKLNDFAWLKEQYLGE